MLTVCMWKCYIGENTSYYYGTFQNDYFLLFLVIIATPLTLCVDLVTSPFQLLTKIVGKILRIILNKKS